jgi:glycosyltransferase involved in cell wall biosynthesis
MLKPMVSCIMPTYNRQRYIPAAIHNFLSQDYPNLELIVIDDSDYPIEGLITPSEKIRYYYRDRKESVGLKRNFACEVAVGTIIIHFDDDDWYAKDWVTRQVTHLMSGNYDISGMNQLKFYSEQFRLKWHYCADASSKWVYGATLAYWRSYWVNNPFSDMQSGEDLEFINCDDAKICKLTYFEGYLGIIHEDNIAMTPFENPQNKIVVIKWIKDLKVIDQVPLSTEVRLKDDLPLVSCIMPTFNRSNFIPYAIKHFLNQSYPKKELIIIDDSKQLFDDLSLRNEQIIYIHNERKESIGNKRNQACNLAKGKIIMHWDDDDWYAEDWITNAVSTLQTHGCDICGLNQIQFFSPITKRYWLTRNYNSKNQWLSGATLAYYKSFWNKNPFKNLQIGEDDDFVRNNKANLFAHNYYQGFVAIIHKRNTSIKVFEN